MKNRFQKREAILSLCATLILLLLGSCASQAAKDSEAAVVEVERVAVEQKVGQVVADQESARAAVERVRATKARERQVAEERVRAAAERQEQEAAEQAERERDAAIAAGEAERGDRLDMITELEQKIAVIETEVGEEASRVTTLTLAVETAEALLKALVEEQAKYSNTDEQGNTIEPLAKELIAELESRKNELVRQANSL